MKIKIKKIKNRIKIIFLVIKKKKELNQFTN